MRQGLLRRLPAGQLAGGVSAAVLLILCERLFGYSLFHVLVELFAVVVASVIFIITWNTRRLLDNAYLVVLGIAFLFVGIVDLLHMLTYKGMGSLLGHDHTDVPTQLWLVARYLQATAALVAPFFLRRRLRPAAVFAGFAALTFVAVASVMWWDVFPTALTAAGLTPFKITSEFVVSAMLVVGGVLLWRERARFEPQVLALLLGSLAATVASEMAFTLYVDPFGALNLLGHLLKVLAFYLTYKALVQAALQRPFSVLFRDISEREAALAESEERFRSTFEQATVGIAHVSLDGRWLRVNDRLTELTGYSREELLERSFLNVSHPDDLPTDAAEFERLVNGDIAEYCMEKRIVRKDGEVRWIFIQRATVKGADGRPKYVVSVTEDIDDRKQAEAALQRETEAQRRIADTLQNALLSMPESLPRVDFACAYRSSEDLARIGGDFYDAFDLGGGRIAFALGDVSGKGLNAATVTAAARSTLRAFAYSADEPAHVLRETGAVLARQLGEDRFVTVLYGTLDTSTGEFVVATAGHPVPILASARETRYLELPANPPLGLFPGTEIMQLATCLAPGEGVVIYSDGVLDARCREGFFGEERLLETVGASASAPAGDIVASVLAAVEAFSCGARTDDAAVAVFRLLGGVGCGQPD